MSDIQFSKQFIERYWRVLGRTLEDIFEVDSQSPAIKELRQQIVESSEEEQFLFYHTEPLLVASDISGRPICDDMYNPYKRIANDLQERSTYVRRRRRGPEPGM